MTENSVSSTPTSGPLKKRLIIFTSIIAGSFILSALLALVSVSGLASSSSQPLYYVQSILSGLTFLLAIPAAFVSVPVILFTLLDMYRVKKGTATARSLSIGYLLFRSFMLSSLIALLWVTIGVFALSAADTSGGDSAGWIFFLMYLPLGALSSTALIVFSIINLVRRKVYGTSSQAVIFSMVGFAAVLLYWFSLMFSLVLRPFIG